MVLHPNEIKKRVQQVPHAERTINQSVAHMVLMHCRSCWGIPLFGWRTWLWGWRTWLWWRSAWLWWWSTWLWWRGACIWRAWRTWSVCRKLHRFFDEDIEFLAHAAHIDTKVRTRLYAWVPVNISWHLRLCMNRRHSQVGKPWISFWNRMRQLYTISTKAWQALCAKIYETL